jgi:hypothetical protein
LTPGSRIDTLNPVQKTTEEIMFAIRLWPTAVTVLPAILMLSACSLSPQYPPDVTAALKLAGDNRGELEKVLAHYAQPADSLKSRAAQYLIGNMEDHCYVKYVLKDSSGNVIDFDITAYPNYDALAAHFDSLEAIHGTIDFKSDQKVMDLDVIKADYLIDQIDYAFRAWQEKPWARGYSFQIFCDYILPYRGSNEPLEFWREPLWKKYEGIEKRMTDSSDPFEAARIINSDVMTWFGFDPRYYLHPTDQGFSEMVSARLGRCEDMTNLAIYALRAMGLAVTSDYTPFWANTGNNHAWNAIVAPDGKVSPFMGAEANPGQYKLANKLAKAYRKTFAKQKQNLAYQPHKQESIPRWLAGKSYTDVTADYVPTRDIPVAFAQTVPDSVDVAYLCVFNSGEWGPIQWGRVADDAAPFAAMGLGIMYLPAIYVNEKIVGVGSPFVAGPESNQECKANLETTQTLRLLSTTRRTQEISTDGIEKSDLTPGVEYELFYWSDGWQSVGKATAGGEALEFDGVPTGAVYWLVAVGSDREERIFTYEDGRQVWW